MAVERVHLALLRLPSNFVVKALPFSLTIKGELMPHSGPSEDDILIAITPRFASPELARAWFETEAIPGLRSSTAKQLVDDGRGQEVLDFIAAVDAGIHA